jgi:hypothetical protein
LKKQQYDLKVSEQTFFYKKGLTTAMQLGNIRTRWKATLFCIFNRRKIGD